jgi:hypothetical protein
MARAACVTYAFTLAIAIVLAPGTHVQVAAANTAATWQTAAAQYLPSTGHFVQDETSPSANCSNEELYNLELDGLALPTSASNYTMAVSIQAHASQSQVDALLFTFGGFAVTINRPAGKQRYSFTYRYAIRYGVCPAAAALVNLSPGHSREHLEASPSLLFLDLPSVQLLAGWMLLSQLNGNYAKYTMGNMLGGYSAASFLISVAIAADSRRLRLCLNSSCPTPTSVSFITTSPSCVVSCFMYQHLCSWSANVAALQFTVCLMHT